MEWKADCCSNLFLASHLFQQLFPHAMVHNNCETCLSRLGRCFFVYNAFLHPYRFGSYGNCLFYYRQHIFRAAKDVYSLDRDWYGRKIRVGGFPNDFVSIGCYGYYKEALFL